LYRGHLLGLVLSVALVPLGSTSIAVALPAIGRELGTDAATLTQWLVNSYLVVGIVLLSPGGKAGDLWGPKRALATGQLLFAAGAGLGILGASLGWLVGARVTMAAGGALIGPATMALLRNTTPPERRARVFGMFGAVMGLSAAVGPPLGGLLVQAFGWRAIFVVNFPILVAAALLLRGLGRTPAPARRVRFDWIGSVLVGAGLTAAVAASKSSGPLALLLFAAGAVLLAVFLRWEHSVEEPVLDPDLFRERAFAAGAAIVALHNLAMYALLFQLPLLLGGLLGSSSAEVGRTLLAMMASMVACAPLGGRVSERYGARTVALVGTTLGVVGTALLAASNLSSAEDALVPLLLLGLGMGLAGAPAQAAALSAVSREQSGMASGALSTLRALGSMIGVGVLGVVLQGAGAADMGAHRTALRIFAAAMVVALLPSALLPGKQVRAAEIPPTPV
jgi:EmrB/QacA subfamily drug resistance transporter